MDDCEKEIEFNFQERSEGNLTREKINQEQIHGLLFEEKLSWQSIIYDLINTEQLDPWDIDITLLANKYLEKVRALEEANFFVSSQVLLAASILLRLKSDRLLNYYLPSLDAIFMGKKEEDKKYVQERIELDEEVPNLIIRTPLPRYKKITLDELMKALGHAINTENRRIRKVVLTRQQEMEANAVLPKTRINLKDKIRELYSKLKTTFITTKKERIAFSEFVNGMNREEKIATFIPILHLDAQKRIWLEQENPFEEIWILLRSVYERNNAIILEQMRREVENNDEEIPEEQEIKD
ncbi:MAG: segregation/condensation protein A [Candidatus Pacearchaeota archaeon]|nr:segregation/condensation protein A [Candidatus Pacearchaeota archaeon]